MVTQDQLTEIDFVENCPGNAGKTSFSKLGLNMESLSINRTDVSADRQMASTNVSGICGNSRLIHPTQIDDNLLPIFINPALPNSCITPQMDLIFGTSTFENLTTDHSIETCAMFYPSSSIPYILRLWGSIVLRIDTSQIPNTNIILSITMSGTSCKDTNVYNSDLPLLDNRTVYNCQDNLYLGTLGILHMKILS
jgi:hypothetical protein